MSMTIDPAELLPALVTLFVVIDPIGVAALFIALTADDTPKERRRTAVRGVSIGGVVLIGFAWLGEPLLGALGIGLPAFRVGGGILLLLLAIDMVMARQSGLRSMTPNENQESGQRDDISVFPLAVPLIAGPGALTSIVLLMGEEVDLVGQMTILGVLSAVLVLTLVCLLLASLLLRLLGVTGINVVTRILGILLAALAVQFIFDGVAAVWSP